MLKVVVLTGFVAAGIYASGRLNQRIRQLKGLHKAMVFIEREIDYELAPLGEAFLHTSRRADEPWNQFFEAVGIDLKKQMDGQEESKKFYMNDVESNRKDREKPEEMIEKAIKKVSNLHPWEKDLAILLSFGKNLGELDKKMQLSKIKMAQEEVLLVLEEAKEEQQGKGKLYQTLGVCMGILGVIILW